MFTPKCRALFLFLFLPLIPLPAQGGSSPNEGLTIGETDPAAFVGLTLDDLFRHFGVPESVYAVRGREEWQDDVVFVYGHGDFYIFKDRVWQAGLMEARGIKIGDSRGVVSLILGAGPVNSGVEIRGDSVLYSLNDGAWPLMLRFDFDSAARVKAIFIYRTDF